jgi:hypothetical protein
MVFGRIINWLKSIDKYLLFFSFIIIITKLLYLYNIFKGSIILFTVLKYKNRTS